MALPVRKGYKGAPAKAVLTSTTTTSDTSFAVDTVTGWATVVPFYCVVDPGTSKEEKVKVTAISGTVLTVVRAQDDTSAQIHNESAAIYPVFTADEADEANEIASVMTTKGDLIATNGSAINRLGVGTNTHVLQADSTATNGFKWGQIVEAGIADSAVTSAKILNSTIVLGDLAAALQAFLVPVGTIAMWGGASAPSGWLLCNGTSTSGYTTLASIVGATTPDMTGKFPLGLTGSGTGSTLRGSGGTNTIAEANLPVHAHSIDHDHASQNTSTQSVDHTHAQKVGLIEYVYSGGPTATAVVTTPVGGASGTDPTYSTGGNSANHNHPVDINAFTGNSGSTGSGTAYFQPFLSVNYIIKHD
jgi:microcystin-dependent protein